MIETESQTDQLTDDPRTWDSLLLTVRRLLKRCQTREDLFQALFEHCTATLRPLAARCDYQIGDVDHEIVFGDVHVGEDVQTHFNEQFLQPANAEMRTSRSSQPKLKSFPRTSGQPIAMVSASLMNLRTGKSDCGISMVVSDAQGQVEGQAVHALAKLDAIFAVVAVCTGSGGGSDERLLDREAGAIHNLGECGSVKELGFTIVNSLCNRLQCEQVSFGIERRQRIEVQAVSGLPKFKSNSPGIARARQVMEECLDADRVVGHQADSTDEVFPIHRQWSADTGASAVLSIPLKSGDVTTAVVSCRRPASRPFSADDIAGVTQMIQPYGSAVRLLERANAPLSNRVQQAVQATVKNNTTFLRLMCWAAMLVGMWWFVFGTMVYQPICQTSVVAAELRHFSAPFVGQLLRVHVSAGDTVVKGQLLAEFDVREQQLQLEAINAELAETSINQREAMQSGDAAKAALHQAHGNVLNAQAGALAERIERGRLVAPANGTVIQADLNRRIGQVFRHGEEVLVFAPDSGWMLEISVPDHVVSHVEIGQHGQFSASARPSEALAFEVGQLDGSASVLDGTNVFMARAPLQENPDWMRNGMQGFGRVETERQPVWWVCCHTAIDWARTHFWL